MYEKYTAVNIYFIPCSSHFLRALQYWFIKIFAPARMYTDMQTQFTCIPVEVSRADLLLIYADFSKNTLGASSYPENHLGLNRLASYLDEKGYSVQVLNTTGLPAGTSGPGDLAQFLESNINNYKILGFHLNSWNVSHIITVLSAIKDKLDEKLILFGGPLPTAAPEATIELFRKIGLNNMGLVQGYGEFKLEEIMKKSKNINEIDGVWTWQNGEQKRGNLQRFTDKQMASLPMLNPKYNTFYQLYYKPHLEENTASKFTTDIIYSAQGLDTNQGCPFNCSYCSVHVYGHTVTGYSPRRACDELEKMAKETGIFMYTFTNSNLMFVRRDWIIDFCNEIIKRNMHHYISWSGYHHPHTISLLTVEDLKLLKKAGCDQIVVGIQSVEPKILQLFNRHPGTYEIFKKIREKTTAANLELVIDYIRGVPGEDLDIVEEFYDYCEKNKIEMREYLLKIYPNTDIRNKDIDFSDYELVPITGNMAEELDAFAVVPKKDNPRNAILTKKITESNRQIAKARKIRMGVHYLENERQAKELISETIPNDPYVPEKVKKAMAIMVSAMLAPPKQTAPYMDLSPQALMKNVILADENAPPMVKKMQQKFRAELGDEKYEYLRNKYQQED